MSDDVIKDISARLHAMTTKTLQLVELLRQRHAAPPDQLDLLPKGRFAYRISRERFERIAAEHWQSQDRAYNLLGHLMGDGQEPGLVSERDRVVAATIMQWLGSNVGRTWTRELIAKFDAAAACERQP